MMVSVVYLSSKLGMVSGEGLFAVIRKHYSRQFLQSVLVAALIGNTIEASADIGGMAVVLNWLIPVPIGSLVCGIGLIVLVLPIWVPIRSISPLECEARLSPTIYFNKGFLTMVVAVIGTTLSAYCCTWQSNQEVEEKVAAGAQTTRGAERS
jgi:Mn2+/Fe2+ NRAMP family transporter